MTEALQARARPESGREGTAQGEECVFGSVVRVN